MTLLLISKTNLQKLKLVQIVRIVPLSTQSKNDILMTTVYDAIWEEARYNMEKLYEDSSSYKFILFNGRKWGFWVFLGRQITDSESRTGSSDTFLLYQL